MPSDNVQRTSRDILISFNRENCVSEEKRKAVIEWFIHSGPRVLEETFERYLSAMEQDRNSEWQDMRPKPPSITFGTLPEKPHMVFETWDMTLYSNVISSIQTVLEPG